MALTRKEIGSLFTELRRTRGRCLQRGEVLRKWLAANPQAQAAEARAFSMIAGRSPRPAIDRSQAKYRDRPYWDARFEDVWRNDEP